MFDGLAENEDRKTELQTAIAFLPNCLFFLLFLFNLFLFNDLIKKMLKVVCRPSFFNYISLLGQLVFCTYTLFGTLKIHYVNGRVDSGRSWFQTPSPTIVFFFDSTLFLNYNIHDIFCILIFHKESDRFYLYFLLQEKLHQPPLE